MNGNGTTLIDRATELEVIGAAIHSPEWLSKLDVPGLLACEETRTILQALLDMEESGIPLSVSALTGFLNDNGRLDGLVPIITDLGPSVTRATFDYHLDRLRTMAVRRSLCAFATKEAPLALESDPSTALGRLTDRLEEITQLADGTSRRRLPPLVDAATMLANPPQRPAELIDGILHQGAKFVLGGPSKGNKTWSLIDMALSVATGSDWWEFSTRKARVLFINLEVQAPFFASRLRDVSNAKGITIPAGQLIAWNLRGHCADLTALESEILRQIRGQAFGLVVLDPIYKLHGGRDENSAGDIADLLNGVERLAVKSGAAVAFGAHFSKGNQASKESIDRIGGSGVFARDPDSILTLTRHEEEGAFTVEPILRNHAPVEPFAIRWTFPVMRRADDLDPAKLKKPRSGREPQYSADSIVEYLGADEMRTSDLQKKVTKQTGMSGSTFFLLLGKAEKAGQISRSKATEKWKALR